MAKVLSTAYQSKGESAAVKNWVNQTVAIRLDKVNADDEGGTRSIMGTLFVASDTETGSPVRIDSARIIGQLAGFDLGDVVIAHVAEYGKRGQILAPPADKDKDAAALEVAFPDEETETE